MRYSATASCLGYFHGRFAGVAHTIETDKMVKAAHEVAFCM